MRILIALWAALGRRIAALVTALRRPAAMIEYSDRVADIDHCTHRLAMARTPDDAQYWGRELARAMTRLDDADAHRIAAERARNEIITTGG